MALELPVPQLVTDPPGSPAELEKAVAVCLGPVRYSDGSVVAPDDVRTIGTFIYRATGGGEEIWNDTELRWQTAPADLASLARLIPLPLAAKPGEPQPWQGVLVAAGQKDKSGGDRFGKAVNGAPLYRLRGYARVKRGGIEHAGLSSPSPDLTFDRGADKERFAISFDTASARDARRVRLALRNGGLATAGYMEIRASGGQEVEIANCDAAGAVLARVVLGANGEIRLEPKAGQAIVVAGMLEADEIRYRPHNQSGKQFL
jgi:hypothetical protein